MVFKEKDDVVVADKPGKVKATNPNNGMVQVTFKTIEGSEDSQWFHETAVKLATPTNIGVGDGDGENPQK